MTASKGDAVCNMCGGQGCSWCGDYGPDRDKKVHVDLPGSRTYVLAEWKARAEKAESELALLQAVHGPIERQRDYFGDRVEAAEKRALKAEAKGDELAIELAREFTRAEKAEEALFEATDEREEFKNMWAEARVRAEKAQAACAEMRGALDWCVEQNPDLYGHEDPEKGAPLTCVARALSNNAGKGWVPAATLGNAIAARRIAQQLCEEREAALRRVEAQAAEMRAVLDAVRESKVAETYIFEFDGGNTPLIDLVVRALSGDAGKGWVSPQDHQTAIRAEQAKVGGLLMLHSNSAIRGWAPPEVVAQAIEAMELVWSTHDFECGYAKFNDAMKALREVAK